MDWRLKLSIVFFCLTISQAGRLIYYYHNLNKEQEQQYIYENITKPIIEEQRRQQQQEPKPTQKQEDSQEVTGESRKEPNRRNLQEPPKSSTPLPSTSPQTRVVPTRDVPVHTPQTQPTVLPPTQPVPASDTSVPREVIESIAGKREPGTFSGLVTPGRVDVVQPDLTYKTRFDTPDFNRPIRDVQPYTGQPIYDTNDPQLQDNQK